MAARTSRQRRAKTSTKATRLIGYTRVSSDEQARNGVSMADQADRIEAYCKANGCELVRIESDRGVSGYKAPGKRPAMRRALAAVKSGEADGIVAIALDRLSRNALEFMKLVEESEKQGWRLVAMDLALDTGTPTGKMTANVLASVAQLYRDQISERTQSALDRGLLLGSHKQKNFLQHQLWSPLTTCRARIATQSMSNRHAKLIRSTSGTSEQAFACNERVRVLRGKRKSHVAVKTVEY